MASRAGEGLPQGNFHVRPEHNPKTTEEIYERLHYYVSWMGVAISDHLQEGLINLRQSAPNMATEPLQKLALKGYSDDEFLSAVKEILCIWLHLEAMDQGGDRAPEWLINFLRLAFGASDRLIPEPKAREAMLSYEHCDDLTQLAFATANRACQALGFDSASSTFAPAIAPLLLDTHPHRQQILEEALSLPIETISAGKGF